MMNMQRLYRTNETIHCEIFIIKSNLANQYMFNSVPGLYMTNDTIH